ncbi:MAG: ATP-binding protein [Agathobacter sp.]|nr:ATP-binding protein [Agathobacter sp.]
MLKNKRFLDFFKSLKFRIIVLIFAVSVIPGTLLCVGVLNSYEARALDRRKSEVISQARSVANQIAKTDYLVQEDENTAGIDAQIDLLKNIYMGRILVVDQNFKIVKDTYNLDLHKTIISQEVILSFSKKESVVVDSENRYIEMTIPISNPDKPDAPVKGVLVVSATTDNISSNMSTLTSVAVVIEILLDVAVLFFGVLAAIAIVKPFEKMAKDIEGIQSGYGGDTLEINNYVETAAICENFNSLINGMKVMDESRQEFVSNVSHELKTPLTSMKVLADSINSMGADAPKELYMEFMGDITNEIERETKIINDLLSLVKMDKSAADLNIETVNINDLLEQILKRLQPIADRQQVELVLESFRPVSAEIDEVKLTLAFTNLIENAIKYNRNDGEGWVHVSLNADHQYFYLKVEDSGIGIPEEELEHIYERFYRVDKSHSREIGGTGLGLAITRNSILMHRGAIKAYSVLDEGTTFDVRIPLNYIA